MPVRRRPKGSGTVRQLPSGRFQATFKHNGQRAVRTVDTKEAANGWLRQQRAAVAADAWEPSHAAAVAGGPLFRTYAEQWLAARDLRPRTRADYRRMLDAHLLPRWGEYRLARITVADVRDWHRDLLPEAPTMRARVYGLFRTILKSAFNEDVITSNPCRVVGAGSVRRATRTDLPTVPQVAALADAMPSPKYRVMVLLAAWCGLRFGELTELRPEDFHGDVIRVTRAVVRVDGRLVVGPPKSEAGVRDVTIPPHILAEVLAYVGAAEPGALLFPGSRNGRHLAPSSLYKPFYRAREVAGVPSLRWHDLRHFAGTSYAVAGATLAETMSRLGHSTQHAALRYQHAAAGRDREIAARLAALGA